MKCPICGAEIKWFWFDGSRAFSQCPNDLYHLIFHIEPLLKKSLWKIVFEREKRIKEELIPKFALSYPDIKPSIARIDPKEAKIIAAMGSRIASPIVMDIINSITIEDVEMLHRKYAMTILIIQAEMGYEERIFKRKTDFGRKKRK